MSIHEAQILLILLLAFIVGFGILAERLRIAYPIVLVIGGLLVSFIPGLPRFSLNPDFVFLAVLPPLLFAGAAQTSWAEFRYNLVSIASLAFGLVGFTVIGVSLAAHWLIPNFDWRVGLLLGAALAPTDAIAATSIASRLGLPKRIIDLLEGESLVNDASGLLALEFSTALVIGGVAPSFGAGTLRFIYLSLAGIGVGLVVGFLVRWVESHVDNAPIEITLSLVTPYVAYFLAEAADASGVLAAVACGLYVGRKRSVLFSARARVESRSFWSTFTFLLNGIVFLLLGLQLPTVLAGIRDIAPTELAVSAAELAAAVILLRLLWVLPATYVGYFVRRNLLHQPESRPSIRATFVLGWTGMRGVVSLAAALAVPATLANGQAFSQRDTLIFLTFSTIFVTLVLQGLTLPALIRFVKLPDSAEPWQTEQKARRKMVSAALKGIEELRESDESEFNSIYDAFAGFYRQQLDLLTRDNAMGSNGRENVGQTGRERYRSVAEELRNKQRSALMALHARQEITEEIFRSLERELDLLDIRASGI